MIVEEICVCSRSIADPDFGLRCLDALAINPGASASPGVVGCRDVRRKKACWVWAFRRKHYQRDAEHLDLVFGYNRPRGDVLRCVDFVARTPNVVL